MPRVIKAWSMMRYVRIRAVGRIVIGPRASRLRPWIKPPMSSQLERVKLSRIAAEIDGRVLGNGSGPLGFWSSRGMMCGGTRGLKFAILST